MQNDHVLKKSTFDLFDPNPWVKGGAQRGGTLIFSHIRRPGLFFGFKVLNFNIFGCFEKSAYFWEV